MRTFILFLLFSTFIAGCTADSKKQEIYTSDKTVEERNALGEKHLGRVYRQMVKWTKQATVIKENVGNIVAIAPTSGVNRTSSSFADSPTGSITLEIVGEKETVRFEVTHITSCAWKIACFRKGVLTTNEGSIEVHQSGMSLEEFNQPDNKIAYVTNQINWRNKYKEFVPEQSAHGAYREWARRARIYASINDLENAISDMRIATILLTKREKEFTPSSTPSEELLWYRQELADYYYCVDNIEKSKEIITEILQVPSLRDSQIKMYLEKPSCEGIK